jgi:hypothetical protein
MYAEHRFANLIWGLEAFHRTKYNGRNVPSLREKIDRILDGVTKPSDKRWLERRLRFADEPTLEQRIFDVLQSLDIGLDDLRLRTFAGRCAKNRNDISHFGGDRDGSDYQKFLKDIDAQGDALSTLYHALLLKEIGVDSEIIKFWIYEGTRAHSITQSFTEVGLLNVETTAD